ncbi:MAG: hypothetical protein WC123_06805 [Bacilli bacterium]
MTTQQEITKLQEQAQDLVTNLEKLYEEVGSYQTAKDELQKVSTQLLSLVDKTKQLSEESHDIIKIINDIGSAKIVERLNEISLSIGQKTKQLSEESHDIIKIINDIGSAKIVERLNEISLSIRQKTKNIMIILISGFGASIILQILFFILGKN